MSACAAGVPSGLVISSTSGTPAFGAGLPGSFAGFSPKAFFIVERVKSRLRKMRHGVITSARLLDEQSRQGGRRIAPVLVTLTYRPGEAWNGRHISDTLAAARQWHKRLGLRMRYVWVAEMQQRGAVHYHVMFWLPHGYKLPMFDKRRWWPYGMSNTERARNAVGYCAKYASKGEDGPAFPRGIRISGAGGLDVEGRRVCRWWRSPKQAREQLGESADIRRITGGRFDAVTGQFWESPWRYLLINGIPTLLNLKAANHD